MHHIETFISELEKIAKFIQPPKVDTKAPSIGAPKAIPSRGFDTPALEPKMVEPKKVEEKVQPAAEPKWSPDFLEAPEYKARIKQMQDINYREAGWRNMTHKPFHYTPKESRNLDYSYSKLRQLSKPSQMEVDELRRVISEDPNKGIQYLRTLHEEQKKDPFWHPRSRSRTLTREERKEMFPNWDPKGGIKAFGTENAEWRRKEELKEKIYELLEEKKKKDGEQRRKDFEEKLQRLRKERKEIELPDDVYERIPEVASAKNNKKQSDT